jgi:putative ABC transport system permease protein
MTALRYLQAGLRARRAEFLAAGLAIGLFVSFLASLGSLVAHSRSELTVRAAAAAPVDWQVQLVAGADAAEAGKALSAVPDLLGQRAVDYARVAGLRSTSATGTRTTGAAYVVSLPTDYGAFAPRELRPLLGSATGTLLQQQTAANLAAGPGSVVEVIGVGPAARARVDGVVDLPAADSFFQVVGAPAGAGASAPPDNVLLVPSAVFSTLVEGHATVVHQLHARFRHDRLPSDPAAAYALSAGRANHYASEVAGAALVGNDLGAALLGARQDAIYAQLLVLLLGIPGVVLAGVVCALVVAMRRERQTRELGLLRLRGASPSRSAVLVGATAAADGLFGGALGLVGAAAALRLTLGSGARLSTAWAVGAVVAGLVLAALVELAPVIRLIRRGAPTVQQAVAAAPAIRLPLPLRLGADLFLIGTSALVFWLTSRGGYSVVVVPEGIPVASVNYAALLAPALAWPGLALLAWRITAAALSRKHRRPRTDSSGSVPDIRAAVVRRRRGLVARGATGLAVAIAVTVSTAIFTTTYDRQARVDVALTVGSDVAMTLPPDTRGATLDPGIAKVPGAQAVESMQHRLAYVGPDLQDLYGIDARTIGRAAPLQNAFTPGSTIKAALSRLAGTPDGALLAQETLHDYQLHVGDLVRLRLQNANGQYVTVPFHVAGVVTEFATAPRDSFVVANATYIATATGSSAVQTLLVRTSDPARVAALLRNRAPVGATVADTKSGGATVTSATGLAAGNLAGLAKLTLGFGFLLAVASSVLALIVGLSQRRRSLVVLALLGATPRQRAGFLWTEARAMVVAGLVGGLVVGAVIAAELVKVLNGIFDPAPEHPAIPGGLLAILVLVVLAGSAVTTGISGRVLGRVDAARLREL